MYHPKRVSVIMVFRFDFKPQFSKKSFLFWWLNKSTSHFILDGGARSHKIASQVQVAAITLVVFSIFLWAICFIKLCDNWQRFSAQTCIHFAHFLLGIYNGTEMVMSIMEQRAKTLILFTLRMRMILGTYEKRILIYFKWAYFESLDLF